MKNRKKLRIIFVSLIVIFILLVIYFLIPPFADVRALFPLIAVLGLIFLILGIILIFLVRKEKGKLKFFLMLTGISATAPLVFTILHNLFYALTITFTSLEYLFEALHVASFIISLLIAPIAFIVGVIGSIICFKRESRKRSAKRRFK